MYVPVTAQPIAISPISLAKGCFDPPSSKADLFFYTDSRSLVIGFQISIVHDMRSGSSARAVLVSLSQMSVCSQAQEKTAFFLCPQHNQWQIVEQEKYTHIPMPSTSRLHCARTVIQVAECPRPARNDHNRQDAKRLQRAARHKCRESLGPLQIPVQETHLI